MEKGIGKIKKNDMTDIIVRIDDFGGKPGLTIREFATSEKYTGFTKSGTRIPADSFKNFKNMINSIDESDLQKKAETSQEAPKDTSSSAEKPAKKSKKKPENEPKEELY